MQTAPRVNAEFKSLIPPLSCEEYAMLEASILSEGCREPLVTWRGILVDGHNRLEICQKHGIPYETAALRLTHRRRVALWIIDNQSGRRNLTDAQRIELAAGRAAMEARGAARRGRPKCGAVTGIRKAIASEAGVCEETVRRYMRIREQSDDLADQVRSGRLSIAAAHRHLTADIKTVQSMRFRPEPKAITEAVRRIVALLAEVDGMMPAQVSEGSPYLGTLSQLDMCRAQMRAVGKCIGGEA